MTTGFWTRLCGIICSALSLLIEINGKRIDLLRLFDPARAGGVAEKLENQKRLYEEMCAGD
jgi:hypothetical protein